MNKRKLLRDKLFITQILFLEVIIILAIAAFFMGCASKQVNLKDWNKGYWSGIKDGEYIGKKTYEWDTENLINVICDKCESENVSVDVEWGECSWGQGKQKMSEYSQVTTSCLVYHVSTYNFRCRDCGYEVTLYR